ncbi:MAG: AbiV family abortive infection protein [Acidobacteria bacterium]|nr:AbiV family abortive infection protein [Acidobacteriota bacterium]
MYYTMPMQKNRNYELTTELLQQYQDAALTNAQELLDEATLLLKHDHHARAYFLAVASIEETGKAVQAFDGIGHNLKDSAVSTRLKRQFEEHSQKVTSAFVPWLVATPNQREEVISYIVNLMIDLKHGREPSMYTDIHFEGPKVTTPTALVRKSAAEDCVRLANDVLSHARRYIGETKPPAKTRVQDEFFAMKPAVFQKMRNTADFWKYYISRMEAGDMALENAATQYYKSYFSKGLRFKEESR